MADQDVANNRMPDSTSASGPAPPLTVERNGSADAAADRLRAEFAERIAAARARFRAAVDAMHEAAEAMQEEGRPPSYRLLHALGDCHRDFLRLRHEIRGRAEALSLPLPSPETLVGIGDLVHLFGPPTGNEPEAADRPLEPPPAPVAESEPRAPEPLVVEPTESVPVEPAAVIEAETAASPPIDVRHEATASEIETAAPEPVPETPEPTAPEGIEEPGHPGEALRQSALAVIDAVLRLVVRDGSDFPPLNDGQAMALALREKVATAPPTDLPAEAAELAGGLHPLAGLMTLVSGTAGLSDADWAAVHARVTETFGRQLAVAAARGRLKAAPPQ